LIFRIVNGHFNPTQTTYLSICEENDNSPTFSPPYNWTVYENSPSGTLVDTLEAVDDDDGSFCSSDAINEEDNVIHYFILSENLTEFDIEQTTGRVTVEGPIDYEEIKNFTVEFFAEDLGVPSLNGTTSVLIQVLDVNDNAPMFEKLNYSDSIVENSTSGTELGVRMQVSDDDSGINAEIRYRISDGEGKDDFSIDSVTGIVSVFKSLDRERQQSYTLTITAYDLGSPSLEDNTTLFIAVLDIDDSPPIFVGVSSMYYQTENTEVGSQIITIRAFDADTSNDRPITYTPLVSLSSSPLPFFINGTTGAIITNDSLCTTVNATYVFNVTAQDKPGGTLNFQTTMTITLLVYDDNSIAPYFDRPEYVFQVQDGSSIGTKLGTYEAADRDICSYPLFYDIIDSTDVSIDNVTAELTANIDLDRDTTHLHKATIRVSDSGTNDVKTGTALVYIIVGGGVIPVGIESNRGFPVSDPVRDSSTSFSRDHSYFYDAYIGNTKTLTTSLAQ
ncbi:PREDICTED: protocadherin gamma-A4-like, partial [Amphimedon queenslandica]